MRPEAVSHVTRTHRLHTNQEPRPTAAASVSLILFLLCFCPYDFVWPIEVPTVTGGSFVSLVTVQNVVF